MIHDNRFLDVRTWRFALAIS